MRVADYVFKFLAEKAGVSDVFVISGGGNMHLVDALGRNKKMKYWCNHHEQASAMAAEGYARFSGKTGVVLVTTGPGGTNAMTGLAGAWLDSIPVLFISGQVKLADTIIKNPGLRQFGDQELNIVDVVKPLVKYAETIVSPEDIRCKLEKALFYAKEGRPGPVWLDIPLDIQGVNIDPSALKGWTFPRNNEPKIGNLGRVLSLLKAARRPLFILGHGIRSSGLDFKILEELMGKMKVPFVTSILGKDLFPHDHPLNAGTPGIAGQRGANFVVQNADLVISVGSRLMLRQIGFNYQAFAPKAKKVIVDIDGAELKKSSLRGGLKIKADARLFLTGLLKEVRKSKYSFRNNEWKEYCVRMRKKYNGPDRWHMEQSPKNANSYLFIEELSRQLPASFPVVTSNGTAYISTLQVFRQKKSQRLIYNKGCASMGYGLPSAIGVCIANSLRPVICLENDGSLQMNIQELQTVAHNKLPIKIVVFNNEGYLSIKITQKNYFPDNICASTPDTGVSCPDLDKISRAYGLPFFRLTGGAGMGKKIGAFISKKGPAVLEVMMDPWQAMYPKLSSQKMPDGKMVSKPLEDMFPFLEREEFNANMIGSLEKEEK